MNISPEISYNDHLRRLIVEEITSHRLYYIPGKDDNYSARYFSENLMVILYTILVDLDLNSEDYSLAFYLVLFREMYRDILHIKRGLKKKTQDFYSSFMYARILVGAMMGGRSVLTKCEKQMLDEIYRVHTLMCIDD